MNVINYEKFRKKTITQVYRSNNKSFDSRFYIEDGGAIFEIETFVKNIDENFTVPENINFLGTPSTAKAVIIIALIWRWTGYNMVFYLAGLQNIEYSVYEAARIDGASPIQTFFKITIPNIRTILLFTLSILS